MRIDSCRKCGTGLEVNKKCDVCRKPNQFFCHNCSDVTDEQIHSVCYLISLDYTMLNATTA